MSDVQPPDDAPSFATRSEVKPPVAFQLGYTERATGEVKTDTWHAYTDRPLAVMETLTKDVFVDDGTGGKVYNPSSLLRFFAAVIVETETDTFLRRMHAKDVIVDINDLGSAMEWLGKRMVGRPLDRPVPFSGGTPGTGTGARAAGAPLA